MRYATILKRCKMYIYNRRQRSTYKNHLFAASRRRSECEPISVTFCFGKRRERLCSSFPHSLNIVRGKHVTHIKTRCNYYTNYRAMW